MKIKTSIIVRTFNEEKLIGRTIQKIQEQSENNFEIIIVDSESSDSTIEHAKRLQKEFLNIRLLSIKRKNFSFGRSLNIGFEAAAGDYCAIVSGHSPPLNSFWLSALVRAIENEPLVAAVFGKQIPFNFRQTVTPSDYDAFDNNKKIFYGTEQCVSFSNANALINKNVWEINKFNEFIPGSEDRIWAKEVMAKGFKIVYEPKSIVFHSHHNETLAQIRERSCINFFTDLYF